MDDSFDRPTRSWSLIRKGLRSLSFVFLLPLLMVSVLIGCVPSHEPEYWVKQGVSQDVMESHNQFCADDASKKHLRNLANPHDEYFVPLDQPRYRRCMKNMGYRLVSENALNREPLGRMVYFQRIGEIEDIRKKCELVTQEMKTWDVESCLRLWHINRKED